MSELPLVSVIIPTYNRSGAVERAVNSALVQTLDDLEVIVIDDASTDDTLDVLARVDDPRLHVVRHERNMGAGAARNTGAGVAHGRYLALLDSDDEWEVDKLAAYVTAIESGADDVHAAVGTVRRVSDDGHHILLRPAPESFEPRRILARPVSGAGSSLVVVRSAWHEVAGCDETLPRHEDWDLVLRLSDHVRFVVVEKPLVTVHQGTFPDVATVRDAEARFLAKHRHRLDALTKPERRQVLAEHHLGVFALALVLGAWQEVLRSAFAAVRTRPASAIMLIRQTVLALRRGLRRLRPTPRME